MREKHEEKTTSNACSVPNRCDKRMLAERKKSHLFAGTDTTEPYFYGGPNKDKTTNS